MDFIDQIKQFSKRVESLKDNIQTEEATKTSIIMPFFSQVLGYDVFNPDEFVPEYTADVGIKKGEKVDYAILNNGKPIILIECKWIGEQLEKHDSQLFRYFGTSDAKLGILTNGIVYRFFTDLDAQNKMDEKPFFEINLLEIRESQIAELRKFCKSNFNLEEIVGVAAELRYSNEFKAKFAQELQAPSDDFIRYFITDTYPGMKTQSVIDHFRPILKKSLNDYISEFMNDKIKSALDVNTKAENPDVQEDANAKPESKPEPPESKILTTTEELGAYFIVKSLLKGVVPVADITYKDTVNYIGILYKGNVRKWICRFVLTGGTKLIIIPDAEKNEQRYPIEDIYDIEQYKDQLIEVVNRYL